MAGMLAGTATGNIDAMAAEKIGEAEAKEIAAEDAGHSVSDVRFDRIEIGTEQGASVHEIEFRTADVEYDYDIAIADGEIVNESRELRHPSARGSQVSRARAKEIALPKRSRFRTQASMKTLPPSQSLRTATRTGSRSTRSSSRMLTQSTIMTSQRQAERS